MSQASSEIFALIFGAFIVVVFSYERFNRITYDTGTRLERLVTLLSPDKLRARRVVIRVWFYYCLCLLTVYAILCVYAEVLPALGGEAFVGAELSSSGDDSIGIPPFVSLTSALILTGLAPSVPVLRRFEEWARVTAHRVAGIPTSVLNDTDILRRKAIDLSRGPQDSLLIAKGDWERRKHYREAAADQVTDPEDFSNDLDVIFAVSSWILDRRLKMESVDIRESFNSIEEELRNRKDIVILGLDERTDFVLGRGATAADPDQPTSLDATDPKDDTELKRKSWDRVASDVNKLAEDLCILLALYVEHGLVPHPETENASGATLLERAAAAAEGTENGLRKSIRQHDIALGRLCLFLDDIHDAAEPELQPSYAMQAFLWSMSLIAVVTIAWSIWPGQYEIGLRLSRESVPWIERIGRFTVVMLNGFILPLAIILILRDAAKQSLRWRNIWRVHWTRWMPQIGIALLVSWMLAMLLLVTVSIWMFAFRGELGKIDAWSNITVMVEREVLVILRGCILGLLVVLLLDGHAARLASGRQQTSWHSSLQWGVVAALAMGSVGAAARALQSHVAAQKQGRDGLDHIDMGLMFYTTVYSALIGFVVIFFLSEVLMHQRKRRLRGATAYFVRPAE